MISDTSYERSATDPAPLVPIRAVALPALNVADTLASNWSSDLSFVLVTSARPFFLPNNKGPNMALGLHRMGADSPFKGTK